MAEDKNSKSNNDPKPEKREKDPDYWDKNDTKKEKDGSYETKTGERYDAKTDTLHIPF